MPGTNRLLGSARRFAGEDLTTARCVASACWLEWTRDTHPVNRGQTAIAKRIEIRPHVRLQDVIGLGVALFEEGGDHRARAGFHLDSDGEAFIDFFRGFAGIFVAEVTIRRSADRDESGTNAVDADFELVHVLESFNYVRRSAPQPNTDFVLAVEWKVVTHAHAAAGAER